ncbi:peptidase S16 [Paenibacillus terrae]|uniref:endopeptidase La n=1 Tax=Paenibacillus terrae TaxID=159743 RepID=A0A4U2PWH6_9BACL|nr:S16 family serine protease [Paenibacillus terrae]TKH43089.1 peptidase S16 [Paenibacillus terrae]
MKRINRNRAFFTTGYVLFLATMVYVLVYMPTPYLIYGPGGANEIKPMVTVQEGDRSERGTFMMTTVSARYANIVMLGISKLDANSEIQRKEDRLHGRSEDEYAAEQVWYMGDSQSSAMEAAYTRADIPYRIVPDYVYVFKVPSSSNVFHPGDEILELNGVRVTDNRSIRNALEYEKSGTIAKVKLKRDGKLLTVQAPLMTITDSETGKQRPGFGVSIATVQKVEPKDERKTIHFTSTDVGGPSAGLMFTMEIYNQLTPGDLSKGYRVAGTGTIDKSGKVGAIGGAKYKIVAADRQGAELFFVPEDNYKEAKAKAEQIGTKMKLVPVRKLDDALTYMEKLPIKP